MPAGRGLLERPPRVINVGLELFATTLATLQAPVIHVAWRPPGDGDPHLAGLLAALADDVGLPREAAAES